MESKDIRKMFFSPRERRRALKLLQGTDETKPEDRSRIQLLKVTDAIKTDGSAVWAPLVEYCPTVIDSTGRDTQEDFNAKKFLDEHAKKSKMAYNNANCDFITPYPVAKNQKPDVISYWKGFIEATHMLQHQAQVIVGEKTKTKSDRVVTAGEKTKKISDRALLDAVALRTWGEESIAMQFDGVRKQFTESEAKDPFFGTVALVKDFSTFLSCRNWSIVQISEFCSERAHIFGIIYEFCGERYTETRTLELAVSYVDRALASFFTKTQFSTEPYDIRLTAITACWLASNLEEHCPYMTKYFIKAYHGSWNKVCSRERELIDEMNWNLNYTTPSKYLGYVGDEKFATLSEHPNIEQARTVKLLIEVGLLVRYEKGLKQCCSSRVLASAAVILASLLTGNIDESRKTVGSIVEKISAKVVEAAVWGIYEFLIGVKNVANPILMKFERHMAGKNSLPRWPEIRELFADVKSF